MSSQSSSTLTEIAQPAAKVSWVMMPQQRWDNPELSVGTPHASLDLLGRFKCWSLKDKSPAHTLWKTISNAIIRLLEDRYEHLDAGGSDLMVEMFMIGRKPGTSSPTILFSCESKVCRQKAMGLVKKEILKDHPSVLMAECTRLPRLLALDEEPNRPVLSPGVYVNEHLRNLGTSVLIYSEKGTLPRKATIGGFITIEGELFGVTAGHVFHSLKEQSVNIDKDFEFAFFDDDQPYDSDDDDELVDLTSRASLSSESSSTQSLGETADSSQGAVTIPSSLNSKETLTLAKHRAVIDSDTERQVVKLGDLYLSTDARESLDWALVKICASSSFTLATDITPKDRINDFVYPKRNVNATSDVIVLVATGSNGIMEGTLSGVTSYAFKSTSRTAQSLLTVRLLSGEFSDGDCGSWVFDKATGDMYGHIVSGIPSTGTAYIMPSVQIFQDIQRQTKKSIEPFARWGDQARGKVSENSDPIPPGTVAQGLLTSSGETTDFQDNDAQKLEFGHSNNTLPNKSEPMIPSISPTMFWAHRFPDWEMKIAGTGGSPNNVTTLYHLYKYLSREYRNAGGEFAKTSLDLERLCAVLLPLNNEVKDRNPTLMHDWCMEEHYPRHRIVECKILSEQLDGQVSKYYKSRGPDGNFLLSLRHIPQDEMKFERNLIDQLGTISVTLNSCTMSLRAFVHAISSRKGGIQEDTIDVILDKVDSIYSWLPLSLSILMSDDEVWRYFRDELTRLGLSISVLEQFENILRAYIHYIDKMGLPSSKLNNSQEVISQPLVYSAKTRSFEKIPLSFGPRKTILDKGSFRDVVDLESDSTLQQVTQEELSKPEEQDHEATARKLSNLSPVPPLAASNKMDVQNIRTSDSSDEDLQPEYGIIRTTDLLALDQTVRLQLSPPAYPRGQVSSVKNSARRDLIKIAPDAYGNEIPSDAKWTKTSRRLISPEVLEQDGRRYEARPSFIAVLGVLSRHEIQKYAERSDTLRRTEPELLIKSAKSMIERAIWAHHEALEAERPVLKTEESANGIDSRIRKGETVRETALPNDGMVSSSSLTNVGRKGRKEKVSRAGIGGAAANLLNILTEAAEEL